MSNVRCDGIMRDTDALQMTVFHYFSCFEIRLHPPMCLFQFRAFQFMDLAIFFPHRIKNVGIIDPEM